jgi:hypothetical protein
MTVKVFVIFYKKKSYTLDAGIYVKLKCLILTFNYTSIYFNFVLRSKRNLVCKLHYKEDLPTYLIIKKTFFYYFKPCFEHHIFLNLFNMISKINIFIENKFIFFIEKNLFFLLKRLI